MLTIQQQHAINKVVVLPISQTYSSADQRAIPIQAIFRRHTRSYGTIVGPYFHLTDPLWAKTRPTPINPTTLTAGQAAVSLSALIMLIVTPIRDWGKSNVTGVNLGHEKHDGIKVVKLRNQYYVSDGHHRAAAAILLNVPTIPARVVDVDKLLTTGGRK